MDSTGFSYTSEGGGSPPTAGGSGNSATTNSVPPQSSLLPYPIEVDDILRFAAHVCSNLGVPVSEEALYQMWSSYKPQIDVVGYQIETKNNNLHRQCFGHFTHNWNNGKQECWNNGSAKTRIESIMIDEICPLLPLKP